MAQVKDLIVYGEARVIGGLHANSDSTNGIHIATMDNNSSTSTAFVVDASGIISLYDGLIIYCKNTKVASASGCTLTVNGLGAKRIWLSQSNGYCTTHWGLNNSYIFIYSADIDMWVLQQGRDSTTTNATQMNYSSTIKCGSTAIVAGNIIVADSSGLYKHLKLGTAFDITWQILYANGAIAASSTSTNVYSELNIPVATTQSLTLTAYKPLYIKGTLSGTTFTPVSTTPVTQTVPSSDDGYAYIYLGYAYSTANFRLVPEHLIYAYKNGKFGLLANDATSVNGYTVAKSVPSDAKFTDTTYESKAAASGGTAVSLVTTGEKYTWNNKSSLTLGNAATNAYYGDKGKTAYDHSQLTSGNPHGVTKTDVGLGNVGNFKAVSTVASQGLTDTEKGNARTNIGAGTSNLALGTTSTTALKGDTKYAGSSSAGGAATSADKLTTARAIDLGTGVTSTATNFDGSADITIPVTGIKEAYLNWGGKNFSGSYGPIDAAMIDVLGANRFAFLKAEGLTVEYSTNGGSTYTDYGLNNTEKTGIFAAGTAVYLGKHSATGTNTVNDRLRITIDTSSAGLYTALNKIAIYVSNNGNTMQVMIDKATAGDVNTFTTHLDWTGITGWSGWNILNISSLTTYGNNTSQYRKVRFTFRQTAVNTNYNSSVVSRIMGFGGVGWTVPSQMARDGHMYSYDNSKNVTFPATVSANTFSGSGASLTSLNASNISSGTLNTARYIVPSAYCDTAGSTAAKVAVCSGYTLRDAGSMQIIFTNSNTAASALTLNINNTGAKPIYINEQPSSSSNYNLPAGVYFIKYNSGTYIIFNNAKDAIYAGWAADAESVNGYTLGKNVPSDAVFTDTKNTAGSTDSSSKLFLIGATSQAANPQTYSHDTAYVGTNGKLYSNSKEVVNLSDSQALTNKTYNGYTLAAASAKSVDTSISDGSTSTNLPTSQAVASFVEGKGYNTVSVLSGTSEPDPSLGKNGDIYILLDS